MKIGRFLLDGQPKVGLVCGQAWVDAAAFADIIEQTEDVISFVSMTAEQKKKIEKRLELGEYDKSAEHSLEGAHYLAPVGEYSNLYTMRGISTIFSRVIKLKVPTQPTYDMRYTHNFAGHNCTAVFTDENCPDGWNQEFIAIIGKTAKNIEKEEAFSYIGGYTLMIDHPGYHRRSPFYRDGMWKMEENDMEIIDHFYRTNFHNNAEFPMPIGPYITTSDEVPEPHNLLSREEENGRLVSVGSSEGMLIYFDEALSYISRYMTLRPGDMISSSSISYDGYKHWDSHEEGSYVEVSMQTLGSLRMNIVDKRGEQ